MPTPSVATNAHRAVNALLLLTSSGGGVEFFGITIFVCARATGRAIAAESTPSAVECFTVRPRRAPPTVKSCQPRGPVDEECHPGYGEVIRLTPGVGAVYARRPIRHGLCSRGGRSDSTRENPISERLCSHRLALCLRHHRHHLGDRLAAALEGTPVRRCGVGDWINARNQQRGAHVRAHVRF